ncbi:response regulator [Ruficoccus sp. ZRK36]|uniref:response regulator n=1 Tax=Ruficoccus sp. ZRK36 TaxID=2866311 RepID=UPI001C72F853|nr:response regulator [Ruficoccus sp. ZRK36]QYY37167.1 response regulator [Ruficoccus sp. ZRK36]
MEALFARPRSAPTRAKKTHAARPEGRTRPRILIAQDGFIGQHRAIQRLSQAGYEIELAHSGVEVMNAVRDHDYDLVLMDVELPDLNGVIAARTIRMNWRDHAPRLVGRSRSPFPEDYQTIKEQGDMDACISCKLPEQELLALIADCLKDTPAAV